MLNTVIGFLVGIFIGSLVDCLANRSVTKISFLGRSFCDSCKKKLAWYDLFPIASYLFNKGRCRYCKAKISRETIFVEVLMGVLVALLFSQLLPVNLSDLKFPANALLIADLVFKIFVTGVLVSVFITDIKTGLIPDRITYPSIIISLIYLIVSSALKIYLQYQSMLQSPLGKYLLPPHSDYFIRHSFYDIYPLWGGLLAAVLVGGFFLLLIVITRGRGMGGGDFKLGIFLGLVFGLQDSLLILMLAFLGGSIVGIILLILRRKKFGQTIPFGPFLSLGALIALFWSQQLIRFYLSLNF